MKLIIRATVIVVIMWLLVPEKTGYANSFVMSATGVYPIEWHDMKLKDFVSLTLSDYYQLTGKKMSLKEKLAFSLMKGKMKRELKKNPEMTAGEFMATLRASEKVMLIILGVLLILLLLFYLIIRQLPD